MPEWPIGTALKAVVDRNANRGFESRPLCAMDSTNYRLDKGHALQLFGWRMVIAAAFAAMCFVLIGAGGIAREIGFATAAVAVALVLFAVWRLLRPPLVIQVRSDGFGLGRITGAGVRSAQWIDVERVDTVEGAIVITLSAGSPAGGGATGGAPAESPPAGGAPGDGAQSRVPLGLLPRQAAALKADVHVRLNAAHGYRRIN